MLFETLVNKKICVGCHLRWCRRADADADAVAAPLLPTTAVESRSFKLMESTAGATSAAARTSWGISMWPRAWEAARWCDFVDAGTTHCGRYGLIVDGVVDAVPCPRVQDAGLPRYGSLVLLLLVTEPPLV